MLRRALALLLPVVLLGGCITTTTPLEFCRERVRAECEREASCQNVNTAQDCIASRLASCDGETEQTLCGEGHTYDPGKGQECVSSYASTDCTALNRGNRPAACFQVCK